MRYLFTTFLVAISCTFSHAQEFSLIKAKTAPTVVVKEEPVKPVDKPAEKPVEKPSVVLEDLKVEVSPISILIADSAVVKSSANEKAAIFVTGNIEKQFKGVIVKLTGKFSKPLLRYYKSPTYFPPQNLSVYSPNEWFFYGDPGEYTVEILEPQESGWISKYLNITIEGAAPPVTPPTNPPSNPPTNPPSNPPSSDTVATKTAEMVTALNDPIVAKALHDNYAAAYATLSNQPVDEMRKIMVEARRNAFLNVKSRNVNWNSFLIEVDKFFPQNMTPDQYKAVMSSYISGFKKSLNIQ